MVALGPVIPLYFNPDMINNLYSILIQEFIEAKSVSNKKQVVVNIKTPLSEFSFDIWGRYVQGELNIQSLEEFVRQRAEENISVNIITLKRLMDILSEQNLIKRIGDGDKLNDINQGDFVSFNCCLNENPVFQHVSNTIKKLEASKCCCEVPTKDEKGQTNSSNFNYDNILASLKNGLNECRNSRCIRYVSNPISNSDSKAVVPCEAKNMLVNNDYMLNSNVHILGKVTRTNNYGGAVSVANTTQNAGSTVTAGTTGTGIASGALGTAGAAAAAGAGFGNIGIGVGAPGFSGLNLLSGTYFDYLNYEQFNNLGGSSLINTPVFSNFGGDIFNPAFPLLEVLPIAIFI